MVEFFLMVVLFRHEIEQNLVEILLDPALMVLISFPILYRFFLLPLRKIFIEKSNAESELSRMNDVLEERVQERTQELAILNATLQNEIIEHKRLKDELEMRVEQRTSELMGEIQERKQIEKELENINNVLTASSISEREQRKIAEGLMEAAMALNSSLTVDDVLDRILDETQRVLPRTAINLMLLNQDGPVHAGQRGFDQLRIGSTRMDHTFRLKDHPELSRLVVTGEPVLISDTAKDADWSAIPGLEWIASFASAPLAHNNKVFGYLQIISDVPGQFNERTLQILNGFAVHAGLAIQNTRLIESMQMALSKERETREELIRSEKLAAMGRTIASVAHELNNPIQTIKNCTYLLRSHLANGEPENTSKELLDLISAEIQRISTLVSQLREIFRPNQNMTMIRVNIGDVVQEVSAALKPQMRAVNVTPKIQSAKMPLIIYGVPDQIRQVFINLFQNAIDAMPEGGRLEVKFNIAEERGTFDVSVADTGPGIPPEAQTKVFEPFYSTKAKGMGLGLPIVFQIIQRHNGTIKIDSTPGKGCAFIISLPLQKTSPGDA